MPSTTGGRSGSETGAAYFGPTCACTWGGRDCSKLAANMDWQVAAVERALQSVALDAMTPITPVLCFIEGDWPLFRPPESYRGVRLEGTRSIRELITSTQVLDGPAIDRLSRILATAFPPK